MCCSAQYRRETDETITSTSTLRHTQEAHECGIRHISDTEPRVREQRERVRGDLIVRLQHDGCTRVYGADLVRVLGHAWGGAR